MAFMSDCIDERTVGAAPLVSIADVAGFSDSETSVRGWLHNRRSNGKLHFLQVRDGSGVILCVVSRSDVSPEHFALADRISQESSLIVRGRDRADVRAPIGYELAVTHLELVQMAEPYPITPTEHGVAGWLRPGRRFRHGDRGHGGLGLRPPPCAGNDPVSADAGTAAAV